MRVALVVAILALAGCASPDDTPEPQAPAANDSASGADGNVTTQHRWIEEFTLEVTEAEANAGIQPFSFAAGANCARMELEHPATGINGIIVAEWEATAPNTQELELIASAQDPRNSWRAIGASPLELEIVNGSVEDILRVWVGAPPGVSLAARQPFALVLDLAYWSLAEGQTRAIGTCGRGG